MTAGGSYWALFVPDELGVGAVRRFGEGVDGTVAGGPLRTGAVVRSVNANPPETPRTTQNRLVGP